MRSTGFLIILLLIVVLAPALAGGQTSGRAGTKAVAKPDAGYRSSPAYAELLVKRTELESELESLLVEYTEDYPKVKEARYTLTLVQKESERLAAASKTLPPTQMTLALGKLIVRKVELETELWNLLETYKPEHPDAKRAKRKVDIYEAAIKEILG